MRRAFAAIVLLAASSCADRSHCAAGDLSLPPSAAFAVLRSDGLSSAIALIDADGSIVVADFVDSGTHVSSLVTSLAGDAVLPSTPLGSRTVAWLDRPPIDVLTLVDDHGPQEIDVRAEGLGAARTGFTANPYDAIAIDGGILVARYQPNFDTSAPELQRGNDVVLATGGQVTRRIALDADETLASCSGPSCVAYARPSVLLPLAANLTQRVLVVLDRITSDFMGAGTGAVVTIDPVTLTVSAPFALPGMQNCYHAASDPTDATRAYVLCTGPTFSTEAQRRASAGIVELTMDESGALTITGSFSPSESDPAPFNGIIALGDRRVLYVAAGQLDPLVPDRLALLDLADASASIAYTASSAFVLGEGALANGGALVPDARASAILRLTIDGESASVADTIALHDCVDLPPIAIRPLRF